MWFLYNILAVILLFAYMPIFLARLVREKGFGRRMRESLGFVAAEDLAGAAGGIWIHAASVGEIVAASPVVKEIKRQLPGYPVMVSTVTATGYAMAKRIIPEADGFIHFPLDLPWIVKKTVSRINPKACVIVETELWPNFLRQMQARGVPVMMANGRISDKSVKRYRYLNGMLPEMLAPIRWFAMQSALDAEHIRTLGADPAKVMVTGNTKYDQTYTDVSPKRRSEIARLFKLPPGVPVIIFGSTHKGEEELIFNAYRQIREVFPATRLVVAPRAILRADEVAGLTAGAGWTVVKRTQLADSPAETVDVVILDTIGELGQIYSIGDIVFVGGSLIPQGGHNVLEPAAHGKPVIVGPHMFNFKETYALLTECGACRTVQDAGELAGTVIRLLADKKEREAMGESALALVRENRGASRRTVGYLLELLGVNGGTGAKA